jgi:3-hydroxybutyryl-CoA dehydrogenase
LAGALSIRENRMSTKADRVGVIGAGLMGAEIALVHALAGFDVSLVDRSSDILESARDRLGTLLDKGIARGFYSSQQKSAALDRIHATTEYGPIADCHYVTEAVFESEPVKLDVLRRLAAACPADCILATNTSTIPISTLAAALPPERRPAFIGTHFFSPVSRMKLVEVISGFNTDERTIDTVLSHCRKIGKEPIRVKDVAGFAVNRMLHAFIIEAVRLVEEGVASPADIDTACRLGLGHSLGPFELMDAVTSTLCVQAQEIMQEAYGERFRPPPLLKQRVKAGFGGGKGKPGWRSP